MNNPIVKPATAAVALALGKDAHGSSWLGLVGAAMCAVWLLVAIFGPWLAPHPVGEVVSDSVFGSFSAAYPL
ncbi:hypothetical protein, partial [Vibrio vulnificus]|uniref:hypothetical protein n=1 Tax=Vibrio vulnificus TaxID=672 RepID=UPI0039B6701C